MTNLLRFIVLATVIGAIGWIVFIKPSYAIAQACYDTFFQARIGAAEHRVEVAQRLRNPPDTTCDDDNDTLSELSSCYTAVQAAHPLGYYIYKLNPTTNAELSSIVKKHNEQCVDITTVNSL